MAQTELLPCISMKISQMLIILGAVSITHQPSQQVAHSLRHGGCTGIQQFIHKRTLALQICIFLIMLQHLSIKLYRDR